MTVPKSNSPPTRQFDRSVILDWNILHYWISPRMRSAITPVLADLDRANLQFTISEISIYEAQCQVPKGKHIEALQFMDSIPRFPINTATHMITGSVMSCYRNHEKTRGRADSISLQDGFNAATAIQNNALLLTGDYEDYPLPFFNIIWFWDVTNSTGKSQRIYLFSPDIGQFEQQVSAWVQEAERRQLKDTGNIVQTAP